MGLFGRAADVACAPIRLLGEQEVFQDDAGTTDWIAVDPVHLRLERERLVLAGDEVLAVNEEEAAALVDTLNGYFPELGVFHAAAPDRWYLKLAGGPTSDALLRLKAPAPSEVIGRSVEGLLADLTEEREVRRLLNEIQTVLHAHPANQRRDAAGRATLNSLWLWGGGRLPQRRKAMTGFDGVHGADALVRGLARLGGVPELPHVDSAEALLALNAAKHALVVLNDLSSPVQYEDGPRYRRTLLDLESRWFGPAWQALAGGRLDDLAGIADKNPPELEHRSRSGENLQRIIKHPAYEEMERVAYGEFGLQAMSHREDMLGWQGKMPPIVKYALTYLFVQSEFGLCCPLSMTDSLTRTLKKYGTPSLVAKYLPQLLSLDWDTQAQGSMFMTEQAAGSDISNTQTMAAAQPDGTWRLTGDKWFCSNPDA